MMRRYLFLAAAGAVALTAWGVANTEQMDAFVQSIEHRSGTAYLHTEPADVYASASRTEPQTNEGAQLMAEIMAEAEKRKEPPIDARVDRVWKAIPGYNGIKVDVEETWKLSQQRKDGAISYVYKQIEPAVR